MRLYEYDLLYPDFDEETIISWIAPALAYELLEGLEVQIIEYRYIGRE